MQSFVHFYCYRYTQILSICFVTDCIADAMDARFITTHRHGDKGTAEIFDLMASHKVAYCPTLSAGEASSEYKGWIKGTLPEPEKIIDKRRSFKLALEKGVIICFGGDAVDGNPAEHISDIRKTVLVMKDGRFFFYKTPLVEGK